MIHLGNRESGAKWAFTDGFPSQSITLGERPFLLKIFGLDHSLAANQLLIINAYNALAHGINFGLMGDLNQHKEEKVMAATLWVHKQLPKQLQIADQPQAIQRETHQSDFFVAYYQSNRTGWKQAALQGVELMAHHIQANDIYNGAAIEAQHLFAYLSHFK
jgi:hypothetical protein